jgi:hypothetical protein
MTLFNDLKTGTKLIATFLTNEYYQRVSVIGGSLILLVW